MLIRTHIGVSLDGFVATPDGLPAWDAMPTFGPGSHGIPEMHEQCAAIAMGRTTFDQGFDFENWLASWPWPGKPVYVLTSSPLPEQAADMDVIASEGGPAGLARQLREADLDGDVQLLGGPRAILAFMDIGELDRLGICLLPVLLGKGIPLFDIEPATFSNEAWSGYLASPSEPAARSRFQLESHRAFPDGAIELVYRREA